MNKRLIVTLVLVVAVVAVGTTLWLLRGGSRDGYMSALPADCRALVCVEPLAMMEEAVLQEGDVAVLAKVKQAGGYGLAWDQPMYMFYTAGGRMGALAAVTDKDALKAALEKQGAEVTSQRGFFWANVENEAVVCFDDVKAMALQMLTAQDEDQPRTELYDLMTQEGGQDVALLPALQSVEGSVRMAGEWQSMAPLLDMAGVPTDEVGDLSDVRLAAGCGFTDRTMDLHVKAVDPNHRLDSLLKTADGVLRPVEGRGLVAEPEDMALSLCVNVDGGRLLEALSRNSQLRTALAAGSLMMDVDKMIGGIDGDVVLAMPAELRLPSLVLSARMKDTGFMQRVSSWRGFSMQVLQASADSCVLSVLGNEVRMGAKDSVFTLSTLSLAEARRATVGRGGEVPEGCLLVCNARPRLLKEKLDAAPREALPERVRLVLHRGGLDLHVAMGDRWSGLVKGLTEKGEVSFD